jgi:hypothetical protein
MNFGRDVTPFLLSELDSLITSCIRCCIICFCCSRCCCWAAFDIEDGNIGDARSMSWLLEVTLIVLCGLEFDTTVFVLVVLLSLEISLP